MLPSPFLLWYSTAKGDIMAELTKYLKLKISADLSADAKYNLNSIDALGSVFSLDNTGSANIRTSGNISLEPQAPSLGGVAGTGTISFGTVANSVKEIIFNSDKTKFQTPISLRHGTSPTDTYLTIAPSAQTVDCTLTFDTSGADKSIAFPLSGNVVVTSGAQSLTSKSIDADVNTLTNIRNANIADNALIAYGKLDLSDSIENGDISTLAAIADTKLATITTPGKVSGGAITSGTIGGSTAINTTGNISAGSGTFSGSITTPSTTFSLLNTTAVTLNVGGAATALILGATTGTATIRNPSLIGSATTQNVFNTVATTVNAFGAATSLNIGATTATSTHNLGTGATLSGSTKTINVGTNGVSGSTTNINIGPTTGNGTTTLNKNVTLSALNSAGVVHTSATGALSTSLIVDGDVSASAAISDTKLATISTPGKVDNSATTATSLNAVDAIVARDSNGDFSANIITASSFSGPLTGNVTGDVTGNVSGTASNVTGVVAIANGGTGQITRQAAINALVGTQTANRVLRSNGTNMSLSQVALATDVSGTLPIASGGTGATTAAAAIANLLPSYAGNSLYTLRVNSAGTGIEWALVTGSGTVTSVAASAPLTITGTATINPTINIPQATSLADGYLSASDWGVFNGKQDVITGGASTITSVNLTINRALISNGSGKVAVSSVTSTELGYLSGVTSGIQTQLGGKEPTITAGTTSQYWRGDKTWQTLNTSAVAEGTNLYFTDARVVSAVNTLVYKTNWTGSNTITITHNFNTSDIDVLLWDLGTGEPVYIDDISRSSNLNQLTLTLPVGITANFRTILTKK